MEKKIALFIDKIIFFSLLLAVICVPFLFSTAFTELFEVPKMFAVYFISITVFMLTLLKFIFEGKIQIPRSLSLYALAIFVIINIASTFTAVDKFTAVFGFPTRQNGGLLSLLAYFVIFATALINLNLQKTQKLIIAMIASSFIVSLWGIPAHFGKDPNCFILTGNLNATCWQKEFDPTQRIFSTLGQPNWLASFIILVIPFALWLLLTSKGRFKFISLIICLVLLLALIFTNSVSGLIGLFVSIICFILLIGVSKFKKNLKLYTVITILVALVLTVSGSTLKSRIKEALTQSVKTVQNGPTPSGQIRLIVWKGAYEAFKNRPFLGWGPENFAYAYYKFRPQAHNNVSEWNFYYNKAHNEFLNYLTNIGIFGLLAYLIFLSSSTLELFKISSSKNHGAFLAKAAICSLLAYQTTIFFGFSTVATQLFMFLQLAATVALGPKHTKIIPVKMGNFIKKALAFLVVSASLWLLLSTLRLFFADTLASRAKSTSSLNAYENALNIFPAKNPFYLSDYANLLATYSRKDEIQNVEFLKGNTVASAEMALALSPNNIFVLRRVAGAYVALSEDEPAYTVKALELYKKTIELAPTDPTSYFDLASLEIKIGKNQEAIELLEKSLDLKPDYANAQDLIKKLQSTIDNQPLTIDN